MKKNEDDNYYKYNMLEIEKFHREKYDMPVFTDKVVCTNLDYYASNEFTDINLNVWIWEDEEIIFMDNDSYNFRGEFCISLEDIICFKRIGEIKTKTKIAGGGGGGSSIKGAVLGGLIAGGAGAVIGSRKKIEEIKSEEIIIDNRITILEVKELDKIYKLEFRAKDYDVFMNLIAEKEVSKVEQSQKETNYNMIFKDIEALYKLKEINIITEDEFIEKKKLLLDKI